MPPEQSLHRSQRPTNTHRFLHPLSRLTRLASLCTAPQPSHQSSQSQSSNKGHGLFDVFRSKSPPQRSSTVPPNLQSSAGMGSFPVSLHHMHSPSPSPRPRTPGNGSSKIFPFRLFHKPTKSVSGASVEAVIDRNYQEGAMSSCSSLVNTPSEVGTGGPPSPPMRDPIMAILDWREGEEEDFKQTKRTKRRTPGVTWELPAGHAPSGEEEKDSRPKISVLRRSRRSSQVITTEHDEL